MIIKLPNGARIQYDVTQTVLAYRDINDGGVFMHNGAIYEKLSGSTTARLHPFDYEDYHDFSGETQVTLVDDQIIK